MYVCMYVSWVYLHTYIHTYMVPAREQPQGTLPVTLNFFLLFASGDRMAVLVGTILVGSIGLALAVVLFIISMTRLESKMRR
jgi:hypothetical protein